SITSANITSHWTRWCAPKGSVRSCWRRRGAKRMGHALTSEQAANRSLFYLSDEHDHEAGGSTLLGFWIYLMSDCLIFAVLFATYGVLGGNYAAGPAPRDLFDLSLVALNTAMLLFSSITYGFAMLSSFRINIRGTLVLLVIMQQYRAA